MDRRKFLKAVGGAGAAAGLVAAGASVPLGGRSGRARASWGEFPDEVGEAAQLPEGVAAKNVLEVFFYGGLSPWETFYTVPTYGTPGDPDYPNEQFYTFQTGPDSLENVMADCGGLSPAEFLQPFAPDENGEDVFLGPFVKPLRDRSDIIERLRVVVTRHELEPHEAAIPMALSGRALGNPKLAGLGAMIGHASNVQLTAATGSTPPPQAYVLYPAGAFPTDNLRAASAVGLVPASARPLAVRIEANSTLGQTLDRNTVGGLREDYDALAAHYAQQFRDRYTRPGAGAPVRASALSDYDFSLGTLQSTDLIQNIFSEDVLSAFGGSSCGDSTGLDTSGMGFKLAAHLLTREADAPRYVCLFDQGIIPNPSAGYDTHGDHNVYQARSLKHSLEQLANIINAPGEDDPGKLNLDETLIVLNTEFGRTPYPQGGGNGRNHHPYGYVNVMFGGPIGAAQKGVVGAIGPDGIASSYVTCAENRAAVMLAAGVWPFESEAWAVGDVRAATTEENAAEWLKQVVLGHTA